MTDQNKPEEVKDEDLDAAQGGFITFGTETTTLKSTRKRKQDGFITYGEPVGTLKQPGTNMEVVNEDE
jgi:hypothetical protein